MWPFILVLFVAARLVCALVNVTIDDYYGDPSTGALVAYTPETGVWKFGPSCTRCSARPDPLRARNGTWHDGTFNPARGPPLLASVGFYGSAVYVYCILSLSQTTPSGDSNMVFFIDDEEVGSYQATAPGVDSLFVYDVLVYSNNSLPMGNHTITIQNGQPNSIKSLMMLDYITYSTDEERTPPPKTPTSAISTDTGPPSTSSRNKAVTGVLVTVCLLLTVVLLYLLYRLFITRGKKHAGTASQILPTSIRSKGRLACKWLPWQLPHKRSISFDASLLVSSRQRSPPDSTRELSSPQPTISPQRQSQALLVPDEPELSHNKLMGGRWASIMSWRDRTVHEAEIPSLPPTSHAPTTILSEPAPVRPEALSQHHRPQHHRDSPGTTRAQPQRKFTVMNV